MALPAQSAPLSEEEFNRLEDLFASDIFSGEAMALDELQGFLCAIVRNRRHRPDARKEQD